MALISIPLWVGLALAGASLGLMAVVRNQVIRRRLRFTFIAIAALTILHVGAIYVPHDAQRSHTIEQLLVSLALINTIVTLLFNPWFHDRVPDRSPAIIQDTMVVAVFGGAAVYLLHDTTFLTASAIAAAAVGFALQDTLGSVFSGLSIQIEKPFRVGHWISVGSHEGAVVEVTWRATKIRTKSGNLVVVPNNVVAKEVINNYSEPAAPTRVFVEVGAAYDTPPNDIRDALFAAMRQVPRLLPTPRPDVLLVDFGGSALIHHARFWIADFAQEDQARDEVRRAIYYEFRRRRIEIPWPIQLQYERAEPAVDLPARREAFARTIAAVPVLSGLAAEAHQALAAAAEDRLFADGECIVREGEPGSSMFLVCRGRVAITVGPDAREVAVTQTGGYFGEMSLLTGEPRSATVTARGDTMVIEISAPAFRAYVHNHPDVIDQLAAAAVTRRRELDDTRAAATGASQVERLSLVQRMRQFFGI